MRQPAALYVHVPFCLHHCGYCDFTLVANRDHLIPEYLRLLARELQASQSDATVPTGVDTIFIGGGTPTHLSPQDLQTLFDLIRRHFELNAGGEFSIEANPDGLCDERLRVLKSSGVNRLSLGVQSFDDQVLKTLERKHTSEEAKETIDRAASVIPNLSVDLIFGVPGQTMESWRSTVEQLIQLPVKHISTYGLTFEQGTPFFRREKSGALRRTPDTIEREMYLASIELLERGGFEHYEVSNFALPGFQCRHNNVYWNADEYFAFGPGAARYINGVRSTNCRSVVKWINSWNAGQPCVEDREELSNEERAREAIMLALRRMQGLHLPSFESRFRLSLNSLAPEELRQHLADGLLIMEGDFLKLSQEGLLIADSVVCDFL
jgi:oxygen-independent coproporphyrinogen-3 oxidase